MSEWRETTIGEISHYVNRGYSPKYVDVNGYIIVNQKCIRNGTIDFTISKLTSKEKRITPDKVLIQGDILINSTGVGTAGRVGYFNQDITATADTHVSIVRINENQASPLFIFYNLRGREKEIEGIAEGSTGQIELGRERLKLLEISLPPLHEQRAIASVLSSLDDKIDLLHRQNQTLEQMAETLFRQWFVEEADDDWEEGVLGDVIDIFDNKRVPLSKMERNKMKDGDLYPYYGAAAIMDYVNEYLFDGEYILLGEDGTVRTVEGYPVLQYATGKFWVNNHAHILKAKEPYNNFFIWNYLSKKNIDQIVTGAVQPKINQGNLKSLDFPKFPADLVLEFNKQVEPLFNKINQNNTQIRTLTALRDTLLPKLMSGEVRVQSQRDETFVETESTNHISSVGAEQKENHG